MKTFKKIMKWIGIVLGGLILVVIAVRIILNIVFSMELRETLRELKAQGLPMTIAEFAPPPVPEAENAAPLMLQAIDMITSARTTPPPSSLKRLDAIIYSNAIPDKVCTDIAGWTDAQREEGAKLTQSDEMKKLYVLLEKAAPRPRYNNNPDWSQGPAMRLPNLAEYRTLARMLAVKAWFEGQSGNLDSALSTILAGLHLSNKLSDEPVIITQLVRISCDLVLIDELERLADATSLSSKTPSQGSTNASELPTKLTRELIAELPLHLGRTIWVKTMDGERLVVGSWVYDYLIRSHVWEIPSYISMISSLSSLETHDKSIAILVMVMRPVLKKDYAVSLKLWSKTRRLFQQPYYQIADTVKQEPAIPRYSIFLPILFPDLSRICERVARYEAEVEVCRVGLALKLFKQKSGAYPDTLDKLAPEFMDAIPVDPFTGKALIYRKDGDGFMLYSLGPNQKDDGGKPPEYRFNKQETDKNFDIVWKCGK